ncbi:hypothetical protein M5689_024100 [Euphorbia peplus]|nr:hypothetical protein M5689_024100 [Euphorbia peplus]
MLEEGMTRESGCTTRCQNTPQEKVVPSGLRMELSLGGLFLHPENHRSSQNLAVLCRPARLAPQKFFPGSATVQDSGYNLPHMKALIVLFQDLGTLLSF